MRTTAWSWAIMFAMVAADSSGQDRVRVVMPTSEEQKVENLLERVADAVSSEDYASYVACFSKGAKNKYCTISAETFVTRDMGMTVGKWVIKEASPLKTVAVVSYTLSQDGKELEYVSTVECIPDGDRFVIAKERSDCVSSAVGATASNECRNGICPTTEAKPKADQPRVAIHLFSQPDGTPDINGPMWLDPKKLVEAYPEKYTGCARLRAMGIDCQTGKPIK